MASEQAALSVTADLAAFAADAAYDDVPEETRDLATRMITDTVGVALAAVDEPVAVTARSALPSSTGGVPTLAGEGVDHVRDAALHDGVLAHALDYDDVHEGMGGHPSAPVVAALLPLAHREGGSGPELLTAFLVGTEAEIRIAAALNPGLYERGWHPTSVTGTIGAAVAAAQFVDCPPAEIRHAIGVAASEASGIKANFGTMTKPFHVGNAARSGVEAAELAAAGFTASEDALEREFGGFCDLFEGDTTPDLAGIADGLGDPWAVTDPRPFFKAYPCCGSTHSAIAAAISIRDRLGSAEVASIEIVEHPRRLDHTDNPSPETGLDAKFSVQYCVGAALCDGAVTLAHFDDEVVPRTDVTRLADVVSVRRDAERFADRQYGAAVSVTTADGETVTEQVDAPPGSADNPMSRDAFEAKFRRCASRTLPEEGTDRSLDLLRRLDSLSDVTELVDALAGR